MKKILYLTILVMTLMPCVSVYSQLGGLNRSLIESMSGLTNNSISEAGDETDVEEVSKSSKAKEEVNFEDNNYGYTGGKSFVTPPQEKFFDDPLSYFGYDFFVDAPTTFSPAINMPIPPDYVLGPKDNVKIILYGNKNAKYNLRVTRDGEIFFPEIGPISIAGLTFLDFKETIHQIVTSQMIGTKVSVTLGSLRSINIFVLGEAYQPGMYTISALSTLTNAIFKSGGVNVTGSLRYIQLKRKGKTISTFDFYDLLLKGDTSNDRRLRQGDVVFIPPITKTVGISGEVGRPGIYELKEKETLGDLIKFAGHLKPKADIFSAYLHRVDPNLNGFNLISVDLNNSSLSSFELNDGDVLSIHSVVDNLKNAVLLVGHAQQPGFFPWSQGMRIGDLIRSSDDLLSMTDLNYVLIKREGKLNQNYDFLQIDLKEVFKNDASESNVILFERDEIIFFPSLLTPEQITTTLLQDKYLFEDNQFVLEDNEWNSLSYLRKSLMEEPLTVGESGELTSVMKGEGIDQTGPSVSNDSQDIRRYYEYSIYDYCSLSEDMAIKVVAAAGFKTKKSIPLTDLNKLSKPEDFINLKRGVENELMELRNSEKNQQLAPTITNLCRRQLLDPVIEIINRQIAPRNEKKIISVYGNVHFPGAYPLTKGMVLEDAIQAAGGLKDATYGAEIELRRNNIVGKQSSFVDSVTSVSDAQAMQVKLQEMDVINIKQVSMNSGTVEITGEVYFSGIYPFAENQTLGDLMRRAGGITKFGSYKAAYFQRESLKQAELERLSVAKEALKRKILLSSQSSALGTEKNELDADMIEALSSLIAGGSTEDQKMGRLVINLESIMRGLVEDIVLEDGDTLHIPRLQQSVSVIGEVFVENTHFYKDGLSVDDYVNLSGGITQYANKANIYLIKVDGRVVASSLIAGNSFFRKNSEAIQPGDTIVVPLEVQPYSGIRASTEITQIIYQMAIAAAAVNSF